MNNLLLRLTDVCKTFEDGEARHTVLRDFNLNVAPGEIVAVCGPSGCGKSTLLNLVAGLIAPDEGTIEFVPTDEEHYHLDSMTEVARTRLRRRTMGVIFQFFNLVPTLTVRENVLLPLQLNRSMDRAAPALQHLDDLGLAEKLDSFPHTLSGGESQRVAIARALAHEPALLLADEPTGNLDHANASTVVDLLWEAVRARGAAMLIATHSERVAAQADRITRFEE
jgi:putative ABC transport system ATP-binding protein